MFSTLPRIFLFLCFVSFNSNSTSIIYQNFEEIIDNSNYVVEGVIVKKEADNRTRLLGLHVDSDAPNNHVALSTKFKVN